MINPEDFIFTNTFEKLCQWLPVHYMCTEEAPNFFQFALVNPTEKFLLVTANSDYSVYKQEEAHPNEDLLKLAMTADWLEIAKKRGVYSKFELGPACQSERCDPSHEYSLRTDRFTWETFPAVPDNVWWFTTNLNVKHPRAEWIPFGMNPEPHVGSMVSLAAGGPKKGLLYVNLQTNTQERVDLKRWFAQFPWVTFREQANLPFDQYLAEMSEHHYVLSPPGCGLDCYRNYEAIYLGTIPILESSVFFRYLLEAELPVVGVGNYYGLTEKLLTDNLPVPEVPFSLDAVSVQWWKGRFESILG